MSTKINVYLSFDGTCEAAISFYEKAFGVKRAYSCTYGEQDGFGELSDADKKKILHSYVPISDETAIMAADVVKGCGPDQLATGNVYALSISTETEAEAKRLFAELSAGGQVTMPLEKAFWNALYGMFTDKFGIQWMVNYNYEDPSCKA